MYSRRFNLGQIVGTPDAIRTLCERGKHPSDLLDRHATGDWGDLDQEDAQANEDALARGDRLLSSYRLDASTKVWIITEADRSATTILLPDNY